MKNERISVKIVAFYELLPVQKPRNRWAVSHDMNKPQEPCSKAIQYNTVYTIL